MNDNINVIYWDRFDSCQMCLLRNLPDNVKSIFVKSEDLIFDVLDLSDYKFEELKLVGNEVYLKKIIFPASIKSVLMCDNVKFSNLKEIDFSRCSRAFINDFISKCRKLGIKSANFILPEYVSGNCKNNEKTLKELQAQEENIEKKIKTVNKRRIKDLLIATKPDIKTR